MVHDSTRKLRAVMPGFPRDFASINVYAQGVWQLNRFAIVEKLQELEYQLQSALGARNHIAAQQPLRYGSYLDSQPVSRDRAQVRRLGLTSSRVEHDAKIVPNAATLRAYSDRPILRASVAPTARYVRCSANREGAPLIDDDSASHACRSRVQVNAKIRRCLGPLGPDCKRDSFCAVGFIAGERDVGQHGLSEHAIEIVINETSIRRVSLWICQKRLNLQGWVVLFEYFALRFEFLENIDTSVLISVSAPADNNTPDRRCHH
mmetsp:Transcript_33692/g.55642  ORF Transcript_33692/g.55642 Transcript_33692/m.55642 type:complete len:262 (-) Transcript_33692:182-967(-)